MVKDISENMLQELRYQAETKFRFALYKRVEFPFLQSVSVKDIFESFTDPEYGYIGTLHLQYTVEESNKYWKGVWYDKAGIVIELAQKLQERKLYNEDRIIRAQIDYMENIYGKREIGTIMLS